MLSRLEAPARSPRFASPFTPTCAAFAATTGRAYCANMPVVDPASYQALLANLGLDPDPRLCVPAVHR